MALVYSPHKMASSSRAGSSGGSLDLASAQAMGAFLASSASTEVLGAAPEDVSFFSRIMFPQVPPGIFPGEKQALELLQLQQLLAASTPSWEELAFQATQETQETQDKWDSNLGSRVFLDLIFPHAGTQTQVSKETLEKTLRQRENEASAALELTEELENRALGMFNAWWAAIGQRKLQGWQQGARGESPLAAAQLLSLAQEIIK